MPSIDIPLTSDTYLDNAAPTTNHNTETAVYVGEWNGGAQVARAILLPDFSSLPSGANINTATLKLTPITDYSSNARTLSVYRVLRDVVYAQTTWNIWKTSNNWGTAGCGNSTTDYEGATVWGTASIGASPTLNSADSVTVALSAVEMQKIFNGTNNNYGLLLSVDTETDDMIGYASTDHATSAYRPKITIEYSLMGGAIMF